jgi:hypothetical protein
MPKKFAPKRTEVGLTRTLTNSARTTFIRCRRRFFYSYEERLSPKGVAVPLVVGSAFHKAMEEWYSPKAKPSPALKRLGMHRADMEIAPHLKELLPPATLERLEVARGMMQGLLSAYYDKYVVEDRKNWEILVVERPFSVPLDGGWTADGKFDVLFRNKKTGKIYVLEHKTTSMLSEDYVGRLPLDDQIHQYAFGAKHFTGEKIAGVVYNVVQKSRLRQKKNESFEEFCKRVEDDYSTDPGRYFWRGTLMIPTWSMKRFKEQLAVSVQEIESARERGKDYYYLNTNHCFQFGQCPFVQLCTSNEAQDALVHFDRRKDHHPELDGEENWA